jgi:putative phosphonate metabolism protein
VRRYAVYYAPPPSSGLAGFGNAWLGRDPETGEPLPQPRVDGIDMQRLTAITASPRRYGFHGTLKAPFELAPGRRREDLREAVADLARRQAPFTLPRLELTSIGGFLALVPSAPSAELDRLARDCVRELDAFRAPLSEHDLERRLRNGLSACEQAYLRRWGYPYVFEFFRFHLTLTERLAEPEHSRVRALLEPRTAPFCKEPLEIGELCLFEQADRQAPFLITGRYPMRG